MALFSLITRLTDGMPLVQSNDPIPGATARIDTYQNQAKAIVRNLDARSQSRMAVESGAYVFSYMLEDNIVYIVMTDKSYPKRLAFGYLSDLHKAFVDELRQEHGDPGWKDVISRTDKPYAFLKFDRTMQRIRKDYADPTSNTNAARLKEELADIQNIMRRNIQEVLDRGEKLEHVSRVSSRLVSESKKYRWGAKKLNLLDMYKRAAPFAIAGTVIIAVIYWRFL